jgi:hypothetical protein
VMLRDDAVPLHAAARHRREHGGRVGHVYVSAVRGYAAAVTPEARVALLEDPDVRYVADDVIAVQAVATKVDQELPTGVDRVEGELSSTISGDGSGAVDIDVAIIDGGFEFTHPDLDLRRQGLQERRLRDQEQPRHRSCRGAGGRQRIRAARRHAHGELTGRTRLDHLEDGLDDRGPSVGVD